jgi:large subunit ribosomal protein L18
MPVVPLRPLKHIGKARNPRAKRVVRHLRVRKKVAGAPERPRLAVFRSLKHIYAQVIDDGRSHTLAAASDHEPALRQQAKGKPPREAAALVGALVAQRARDAGITQVVFDRGGFAYHGRVQALADAARKGGLNF